MISFQQQGTLTPLLGVGACVSIQFGVVEAVKRHFQEVNQRRGIRDGLTGSQLYQAGAAAGIANSVVAGECVACKDAIDAQTY
jgi:solute carrier family 25 carnitine/acylcarnitine transporter 20/29